LSDHDHLQPSTILPLATKWIHRWEDFFKFSVQGILLKGGEVLDALAVCDTVAFDKTGTLTTGELICKAIEPLRGHGLQEPCCIPSCETEALAVATALERGAIHPIARAVVDHSQGKELPAVEIDDFEAIPGEGLMANVSNLEVHFHPPP
jgi:Cd2+/Zn2+-exporting ATPase